VALSVSAFQRILPVRKYGALCCPDFPPFPESPERAIEQAADLTSKLQNIINFVQILAE